MLAPLRDMDGKVRYVLGAQIDVSNLVPDSTDGQTAASGKPTQAGSMNADGPSEKNGNKKGEYRDLGEMLDGQGGSKVSKWRAQTMQEESEDRLPSKYTDGRRSRVLLRDPSSDSIFDHETEGWVNSKLSGFYQNVSPSVVVRCHNGFC